MSFQARNLRLLTIRATWFSRHYAIQHAGIDFVVLERRTNVVEDLGSSLVPAAPSLRILHQFGIFDQLVKISAELFDNKAFTIDERVFKSTRLLFDVFLQEERGWVFLYEKLPEPTAERITFSICSKQLEEYTREDVFEEHFNVGGAGLEEGICESWSRDGRIILVGDSAHKFTPNVGHGSNTGIQDVVMVCDKLQKLHVPQESGKKAAGAATTDFSALERAFKEHRKEMQEEVQAYRKSSARMTRMHERASWWN
ncbi:uncharacterized protein LY79DRAFT_699261 [Colletotrichum navitas]|uniref:FAD-binding domain-containing protein n=1 Tax=Colletotrichum navitas TaxID=681940 RepID=A0AAD8VBT4_9PEZI|nr:uncharacterized protein LY79DRAFT_699261 [Colletotrichum navitas]KAK1599346.1 hypothetical protein LY79DRAFT_699261 [Colletotrichum navitas]